MSFSIENRIVLITGANRGIGAAFVDSFLEHGAAKVYAAVRSLDTAAPLVARHGHRVVPIHIDLEKPETILAAAAKATDVEVVVNNAGVFKPSSLLEEGALESFEFELLVNVRGLVRMAQAFAPVLARNGGGAFIQINSVASLRSFVPFATYSASKAAAYSFTLALRELLATQGTRVVSVHPGPIATDMGTAAGLAEIAEPPSLVPEAVIEALIDGRFHVFPGTLATEMGAAYADFARNVLDPRPAEG